MKEHPLQFTNEKNSKYRVATLRECPGLEELFWPQKTRIWPGFVFHDIYAIKLWHYMCRVFDEFQVYLLNDADQPVAVGQTIPCVWNGTVEDLPVGWADSLTRGIEDHKAGREPNTLCALEMSIQPEYRGQGTSYELVQIVRTLASKHQFQAVIVPARPWLKPRYPLTPMERYVRWKREDGTPFDPWLRVHWRCGAEVLKTAHPSMVIEAAVADWEKWTGLQFPESGDYIVPDTLAPVQIDREINIGRYIEPNIWVHHPLTTKWLVRNAT